MGDVVSLRYELALFSLFFCEPWQLHALWIILFCISFTSMYRAGKEKESKNEKKVTRNALREGRPSSRQSITIICRLMGREWVLLYFKLHTYIYLFDIDPDHSQNVTCSLYHCWAILKISSKSVENFFLVVLLTDRQVDRQMTDQPQWKHNIALALIIVLISINNNNNNI